MELTIASTLLFVLVCLCFGSAMTAYISRTPKYEEFMWRKEAHQFLELPFHDNPPPSFHSGRSLCPKCKHTLKFYDLIPILSFISTKGRCRYCKNPVPLSYPITELASLLICFPLLFISTNWVSLLILTCIFNLLICISIIDWKVQWIPDQLNLLLLGFALTFNIVESSISMNDAVLGMMLGYLCIVSIRQLYLIFKDIEAIGLGDAKLLAALGAWQGVESLFYILFYASIAGVVYAILSRKGRYQSLAFGPFLCFSALLNFFITNHY